MPTAHNKVLGKLWIDRASSDGELTANQAKGGIRAKEVPTRVSPTAALPNRNLNVECTEEIFFSCQGPGFLSKRLSRKAAAMPATAQSIQRGCRAGGK